MKFETVYPDTKLLVNRKDAKDTRLFKQRAQEINGLLVTLPNFGAGSNIAEAIMLSGLKVPVSVHAFPDVKEEMNIKNRRDSFCGKIFLCNILRQYGIKYSLTSKHTESCDSEEFARDLEELEQVCKVVNAMKSCRIGLIGTSH